MKARTKTTKKSQSISSSFQTLSDLKNAVLIVSLLLNLLVITAWLVVAVNPDYSWAIISK